MQTRILFGSTAPNTVRRLNGLPNRAAPTVRSTPSSLHNLAVPGFPGGRIDAAIREFHRALQIREGVLGENDPATAQTLNSLSAVYVAQRKYEDAEWLCKRALAIEERVLGPEHLQVSATLDNLASIYSRHGQFEAALDLSRRER